MFIDSHCHLDRYEKPELEEIIEKSKKGGIAAMLTVCTSMNNFQDVIKIAEKYDNVFASVGIHPGDDSLRDLSQKQVFDWLLYNSQHEKVVCIGEAGVDTSSPNNIDLQKSIFKAHIKAAIHTCLPLSVHVRDAHKDVVETVNAVNSEEGAKATGAIHCFTGTKDEAAAELDVGFFISFSGIVTFKNAAQVKEAAKFTPTERMLIETDSPWLSPEPHRGKKNVPIYVNEVAKCIAAQKGVSVSDVAKTTSKNFFSLFEKASSHKNYHIMSENYIVQRDRENK
ncbi:TatD family hydrolase [Candidatus Hydrogenosomobacter endosymbioticus]|uniref:Deoxyribonuclease n=1 Tax=Candidatus Hydrogenosomobacter endosymbioticus TaxID=2558174 RepID=A0ABM7V8P5_9PROT|nr:TatD family hydrolase [Candidatus Hydrogenosomobacter endosymbioticus]BDB96143.1 deoxyribonuclease [Candidatus Hydrogenosomobacter endosymbioticus]